MSTGSTDVDAADDGDEWASQDNSQEQVETTIYQGEDGKFLVETIKPLVLLRNASAHGVLNTITGEADDESIQQVVANGQFGQFMDDTIAPRVRKPEGAYWTVPEGGPPEDGYDLADMGGGTEDLFGLLGAMTGTDGEELEEMAESFRD